MYKLRLTVSPLLCSALTEIFLASPMLGVIGTRNGDSGMCSSLNLMDTKYSPERGEKFSNLIFTVKPVLAVTSTKLPSAPESQYFVIPNSLCLNSKGTCVEPPPRFRCHFTVKLLNFMTYKFSIHDFNLEPIC